jgi:hypothetical protein
VFLRAHAPEMMVAMLETSSTSAPEASPGCGVLASLHGSASAKTARLKFKQTKIEALNFEIAGLKRWRFGTSSESLDGSAQTVLVDRIVTDTREETPPPPLTPPTPHCERPRRCRLCRRATPCANPPGRPAAHRSPPRDPGRPLRLRPGVQARGRRDQRATDCVPAQFFVQRHIRGTHACACCRAIQAAPMPAQIIDKGIPAPGLLAQVVIAKHGDPNFRTIGRCTARKRSASARAFISHARAWRSGSASAGYGWPRWPLRCASSSAASAWSTPTGRRCSC